MPKNRLEATQSRMQVHQGKQLLSHFCGYFITCQTHNEVANDSMRLVHRILTLLTLKEIGEVPVPGGHRSFLTLEDHESEDDFEAEQFAAEFMNYLVPPLPELSLVKKIFQKVSINSFSVGNSTGNTIGIGLCIKLSAANHSCKPMTRVCYRNRTAMLVPICDEMPTSLETACHSYIDELMPMEMRKEALKRKYKFDCECDGCLDEERNGRMEAWSCGICVDGWVRNREGSKCELCGWKMTKDHFDLCRVAEVAGTEARSKLECEAIEMARRSELCEKLTELFQDTLHTFNVHRIPILRFQYIAAIANKE